MRKFYPSQIIKKFPEGVNIFRKGKNYGVRIFNQTGNTATGGYDLISMIRFYEDEKTGVVHQQYRSERVKTKEGMKTNYLKDLISFPRAQADEVARAILLMAHGNEKVAEVKEEIKRSKDLDALAEEFM
uniref:Uncharacterized protein n=1 Tax=viral metagenome TaxID=1070528 RepID=A0A6H1ZJP6_9ZZZZ